MFRSEAVARIIMIGSYFYILFFIIIAKISTILIRIICWCSFRVTTTGFFFIFYGITVNKYAFFMIILISIRCSVYVIATIKVILSNFVFKCDNFGISAYFSTVISLSILIAQYCSAWTTSYSSASPTTDSSIYCF